MSLPSVSVIIPTYNRARYLEAAVASALAQKLPAGPADSPADLEVLIIDDGSTDETPVLAAKLAARDPRVRVLRQANQGVSAARNYGLREARGNWIAFLDSDDEWRPGKLMLQLEALAIAPEAGMIWTNMDAIDDAGAVVHEKLLRSMYLAYRHYPHFADLFSRRASIGAHTVHVGEIYSPMVTGNLVHTSTVLLSRERARRAGFFREEYRAGGEDYEFYLRVCREGPVAFVDESTTLYRVGHLDALTHPRNNVAMAEAFLETLERSIARDRDHIDLPPGRLDDCLPRLTTGRDASSRS